MMSNQAAKSIIQIASTQLMKTQIAASPILVNEAGVEAVKSKYGKSPEELYDIITPADGSGVKVWSHGTGVPAARTVTAGIPGRHVYLTAGPTRTPEIMGIVNRTK
jgi:hypothetical protein